MRAAPHAAVHRARGGTELAEELVGAAVERSVGVRGADAVEVARHAADRRSVGAAVVVHDDDEVAVVVVGDVVERLPRHAAGERAVADDRDDVPVLAAGAGQRARDAVRPAQRARRVRGLDDVVRALGALRVAGEAAARAQLREVLASGEELVDVRLVAGVEDERVVGRVEDAVKRDRELDDAEVRPEVATGARDVLDEELADLGGELLRAVRRLSASRSRGPVMDDSSDIRLPSAPTVRPVQSTRAPARGEGAGRRTRPIASVRQTSERSTYCRMPPLR